jgi:sialate O-acetylesterase
LACCGRFGGLWLDGRHDLSDLAIGEGELCVISCKKLTRRSVCRQMKPLALLAALSGLLVVPSMAAVRLHPLFAENAVFQCDKPVPVWGWADKGEEITVTFADQTKSTKADEEGRWMVKLDAMKAAASPGTLTVKGTNVLTAQNVLVGEVWLGSGQSNMAMTVHRAKDFEKEKQAAELPEIRMFTVKSPAADEPQSTCEGQWLVCSPDTVAAFSATAYFFGREIHRELKVPVGLINSSVGGTPIDSWVSAEAQRASVELKPLFAALDAGEKEFDPAVAKAQYEKQLERWEGMAKQARAEGKPAPRKPQNPLELRKRKGNIGGLYNGKIAPLAPYALRGVLWYQGEANTTPEKAPYYQYHLPLLVNDWRKEWGEELPFAWVQLPNFIGRGEGWCLVREAMLKTLKTGMAVTIDVGDPKDIHPKNKQAVGQRLALWALNHVYGKQREFSGPMLASQEVSSGKVVLSFTHADGLTARDGVLREFVIAGEDKQWKLAKAEIVDGKVHVSSSEVPNPIAVRYAWLDNCQATLFNGAGLPASPFRTDDWPVKLEEPPARPARARGAAKKAGEAPKSTEQK